MKKILIIFFFFFSFAASSQMTGSGISGDLTTQDRLMKYGILPDVEEKPADVQKLFAKQQWVSGTAYFNSGRDPISMPMIFDPHNDMLYYLQGSVIMEFVDTVAEFSLKVPRIRDTAIVIYKRFYPSIQTNTEHTFYQVLVNGPVQLLKCESKTISLFKEPDLPEEKKDANDALYFAFLPNERMVVLRMDNDEILKRMPEYAKQLKELLKHTKIKKEDRLIKLITELNQDIL